MVKAKNQRNTVRIIAGEWRSRLVTFASLEGLRPTPDRVRETVFNWLQPWIAGARCLDLFAGSGVLGFEAASRGASEVVLVDKHPEVLAALRAQQAVFKSSDVHVVASDALSYLDREATPFDIVFLDPPYASDLLGKAADLLERMGWLTSNTHIYLECDRVIQLPTLPPRWEVVRSGIAGQVAYHLVRRHGA